MTQFVAKFSHRVTDHSRDDKWQVYNLVDPETKTVCGVLGITDNWDDTQTFRYKYHTIPKSRSQKPSEIRGEVTIPKEEDDYVDITALFDFGFNSASYSYCYPGSCDG